MQEKTIYKTFSIDKSLVQEVELTKENFEKNYIGENVKQDFFLSRMALILGLKELGIAPTYGQLKLLNYQTLLNWPQLKISLTHSKEIGAAIISSDPKVLALGIDIEKKNRQVPIKAAKRYLNPKDSLEKSSPMHLWVAKESVFKALSNWNLTNHKIGKVSFTDFWCDFNGENTFQFGQDQVLGEGKILEINANNEPYLLSLVILQGQGL